MWLNEIFKIIFDIVLIILLSPLVYHASIRLLRLFYRTVRILLQICFAVGYLLYYICYKVLYQRILEKLNQAQKFCLELICNNIIKYVGYIVVNYLNR